MVDKAVRDKMDIVISTPLRLVAAIQAGHLELDKYVDSFFYNPVAHVAWQCSTSYS